MFLKVPLGTLKMLKVGYGATVDQHKVYHTGVWSPPKLLAEAKSDANERRLRSRDLTRPGRMAGRVFVC